MKRRYTRTALADIDGIYSYLTDQNPLAANGVLAAIEKTIARLEVFPYSAVATNIADVRVATIYPFPYLIFYQVENDTLLIRNVRHAARRRSDIAGISAGGQRPVRTRAGVTRMEHAVFDFIANTYPEDGAALRAQVAVARLRKRDNTGSGFFTYFDIDRAAPPIGECKPRDMRDGPFAAAQGATHGMGFILWLKDGYADCLEGYCYGVDDTKGWDLENLAFALSASPPDPGP